MPPKSAKAEACQHASVDFLGEDEGRNRYLKCRECGAVLVHDGANVWMIPPSEVPPDL